MWQDNETTEDLLGFGVHADMLRSIVCDPGLLPVTIGVFGDWGSGKTSVMSMLQESLDPESYIEGSEDRRQCESIACLYFNGWLFEGYDDAKSAILTSVLMQLAEHRRFGVKVRSKVVSLIKSVNWMRLVRMGVNDVAMPAVSAYLTGGASLVPTLAKSARRFLGLQPEDKGSEEKGGEPAESEAIDWEDLIRKDTSVAGPLDVRTFRERFIDMLDEGDIGSLVVLIDDLDRCSPERIIDNLEAIKLFLNTERTAFVIGADPRIVRHAVRTKYPLGEMRTQDEPESLVTDYLEKLIQIPYQLPRLSPPEVETYMVLLFCKKDLDEGKWNRCQEAYKRHRSQDRYSVFGYGSVREAVDGSGLPTELSRSLTFCAVAAPLITEGLKGNPRQIKRFLNAFMLRKKLAKIASLANVKDDVLVKLMVLEYGHLSEFRQLYDWQASQEGSPVQIQSLEKALRAPDGNVSNEDGAKKVDPSWATDFMRRWVGMDPSLSEVDLRDYFWIARDRLQSTLSDVSLIPPAVRRVLEDLTSGNSGRLNRGARSANELGAGERTVLLSLVEKHIVRNPGQKSGYDAMRSLMEEGVQEAVSSLNSAIAQCPPGSIEPTAGHMLLILVGKYPELQASITKLEDTETKVGAAIKQRKKRQVAK